MWAQRRRGERTLEVSKGYVCLSSAGLPEGGAVMRLATALVLVGATLPCALDRRAHDV